MNIINFTAKEVLPSLLNRTKVQTIRLDKGKPAKYEVGETVQLMWKQRSKYEFFCSECGVGGTYNPELESNCYCETFSFNKKLGEVKITEVFKIEMWHGNDAPLVTGYKLKDTYNLASLDGFKPGHNCKYISFYNFFFKYDLWKPKTFHVYRWKWLQ